MSFFIIILILVWTMSEAQVNKTLPKSNTGRGVIVGKEGVAYKFGNKKIEVIYESNGPASGNSIQKTMKRLSVKGAVPVNGLGISPGVPKVPSLPADANINPGENNQLSYLYGEPVPGAEILIEQEPSDLPVQKRVPVRLTNTLQTLSVTSSPSSEPKKLNIFVKLNESCFPRILSGKNMLVSNGIYLFGIETTFNGVKYLNQFIVVIYESASTLNCTSGPFSQSLSNIEDNGKLIDPAFQNNIEVGARILLINSFTNVNGLDVNNKILK